jgi:hypothetical protein
MNTAPELKPEDLALIERAVTHPGERTAYGLYPQATKALIDAAREEGRTVAKPDNGTAPDGLWVWLADNGNIRKFSTAPFDQGVEYRRAQPVSDADEFTLTVSLPEGVEGLVQSLRIKAAELSTRMLRKEVWGDIPNALRNAAYTIEALSRQLAAPGVVEQLREIAETARELITTGMVNRGVDRGLVVVEKADKSDPHYRLCSLLEQYPRALTAQPAPTVSGETIRFETPEVWREALEAIAKTRVSPACARIAKAALEAATHARSQARAGVLDRDTADEIGGDLFNQAFEMGWLDAHYPEGWPDDEEERTDAYARAVDGVTLGEGWDSIRDEFIRRILALSLPAAGIGVPAGWRDIKSAPKCVASTRDDNGRRPVIVTRSPHNGFWAPMAVARLTTKGWISGKKGNRLWFEPTHWTDLPAPPSAAPLPQVEGAGE